MKKNLILSVLFLLAIFASCSKETTYSITNATGSLIAVRVHEYDDKDKPIKIQEETVLSTSPITFIAHEKAETIKIYITKALSQYGTWINENLWIQQVYYLDDTQSITIDGNTIVGNVEALQFVKPDMKYLKRTYPVYSVFEGVSVDDPLLLSEGRRR